MQSSLILEYHSSVVMVECTLAKCFVNGIRLRCFVSAKVTMVPRLVRSFGFCVEEAVNLCSKVNITIKKCLYMIISNSINKPLNPQVR